MDSQNRLAISNLKFSPRGVSCDKRLLKVDPVLPFYRTVLAGQADQEKNIYRRIEMLKHQHYEQMTKQQKDKRLYSLKREHQKKQRQNSHLMKMLHRDTPYKNTQKREKDQQKDKQIEPNSLNLRSFVQEKLERHANRYKNQSSNQVGRQSRVAKENREENKEVKMPLMKSRSQGASQQVLLKTSSINFFDESMLSGRQVKMEAPVSPEKRVASQGILTRSHTIHQPLSEDKRENQVLRKHMDAIYKSMVSSRDIQHIRAESKTSSQFRLNLKEYSNNGKDLEKLKETIRRRKGPAPIQSLNDVLMQLAENGSIRMGDLVLGPGIKHDFKYHLCAESKSFFQAVADQDVNQLKYLLKQDPALSQDINQNHLTGLALACRKALVQSAQVLVKVSSLESQDIIGRTPLFFAVQSDSPALVHLLLSHRACPWSQAQMSLDETNLQNSNRGLIASMLRVARAQAAATVFRKARGQGLGVQNNLIQGLSRQMTKIMTDR